MFAIEREVLVEVDARALADADLLIESEVERLVLIDVDSLADMLAEIEALSRVDSLANMLAIWPTSVFIPVAVTMAKARP